MRRWFSDYRKVDFERAEVIKVELTALLRCVSENLDNPLQDAVTIAVTGLHKN